MSAFFKPKDPFPELALIESKRAVISSKFFSLVVIAITGQTHQNILRRWSPVSAGDGDSMGATPCLLSGNLQCTKGTFRQFSKKNLDYQAIKVGLFCSNNDTALTPYTGFKKVFWVIWVLHTQKMCSIEIFVFFSYLKVLAICSFPREQIRIAQVAAALMVAWNRIQQERLMPEFNDIKSACFHIPISLPLRPPSVLV